MYWGRHVRSGWEPATYAALPGHPTTDAPIPSGGADDYFQIMDYSLGSMYDSMPAQQTLSLGKWYRKW
jgi:hypothetical protein